MYTYKYTGIFEYTAIRALAVVCLVQSAQIVPILKSKGSVCLENP